MGGQGRRGREPGRLSLPGNVISMLLPPRPSPCALPATVLPPPAHGAAHEAVGVRGRILVHDLYTAANDQLLQGMAATPNVQIRLFNPFPAGRALNVTRWGLSLLDLARLNHRMHNKLMIADGLFAIAGGRNIAD